MDNFIKMIFIHISAFMLISSVSRAATDDEEIFEILSVFNNPRMRREVDGEDVINRFEIERVSPLYDIIKHLPPFDDDWIPNPVNDLDFPSPTAEEFKNESSNFGEFKIEVSKDEEHVVTKNGRHFHENAALNWYYSAESYTNVNHRNNTSPHQAKLEMSSPKTFTSRRLDEDHVVSHIPSLRDAFLEFNMLQSSVIPKVDITTTAKEIETKPKVETRYILLQSGRIVAINVTTLPTVVTPASSGLSGKNPNLPTFYFGSRIRNKNRTISSENTTKQKEGSLITIKPEKVELTTKPSSASITKAKLDLSEYAQTMPSISSKFQTSTKNEDSSSKRLSELHAGNFSTVKPHTMNTKSQSVKQGSQYTKSLNSMTIQPHITYTKLQTLKQIPVPLVAPLQFINNKTLGSHPKVQSRKEDFKLPKTTLPPLNRDSSTLDPAEKWWSEMKDAKRGRKIMIPTTVEPKTTKSLKSLYDALLDVLQPPTIVDPILVKTFDSAKMIAEKVTTRPTIELITNYRSSRPGISNMNPPYSHAAFNNRENLEEIKSNITHKKQTRFKVTTNPASLRKDGNPYAAKTPVKDLLETSAPLSDARHDFVRILTSHPPAVTTEINAQTLSPLINNRKISSKRPKYRGLSHVKFQAPIRTTTISPTLSISKPVTFRSQQVTTFAPRRQNRQQHFASRTTKHPRRQSTQPANSRINSPPPRQLRNRFFLRNSASFQTIPPGSLTDRRTLTTPKYPVNDTIRNLPPPIEELLIISFEPTRKSVWVKQAENAAGTSPTYDSKTRIFQAPTKRPAYRSQLSWKHDAKLTSTAKPGRTFSPKPFGDAHSNGGFQSKFNNRNRLGRNFRPNDTGLRAVAKPEKEANPHPTTKKPFRVYYFEPKRRKPKQLETEVKNKTSQYNSRNNYRHNNNRRAPTTSHSRNSFGRGYGKAPSVNERQNNRRQPKQFIASQRTTRTSTEAATTSKPKKFKSNPFIWHRPNVGNRKSPGVDFLIEVPPLETSSQPPSSRNTNNNGYYRSVNIQRRG